MAFRLVLYSKAYSAFSLELFGACLLGVKVIKTRLAGYKLAFLGELQPFSVGFVCFHDYFFSMVMVKPFGPFL